MYLALKDFQELFQETRGAKDNLLVYSISDQSRHLQPKGVFVPINEESGELLEAIANGAIAAIWDRGKEIPPYTPSQFPLFLTSDLAESVRCLLQFYIEKLDGETDKKMEITKFDFLNKKLLNKNNETYDIAGMLNKLFAISHTERRG
jgi:UDP-N-acetylmuramyl pentapeptide synthase